MGCIVWGSQGGRLAGHKDRVDSRAHLRIGVGPHSFPRDANERAATGRREQTGRVGGTLCRGGHGVTTAERLGPHRYATVGRAVSIGGVVRGGAGGWWEQGRIRGRRLQEREGHWLHGVVLRRALQEGKKKRWVLMSL